MMTPTMIVGIFWQNCRLQIPSDCPYDPLRCSTDSSANSEFWQPAPARLEKNSAKSFPVSFPRWKYQTPLPSRVPAALPKSLQLSCKQAQDPVNTSYNRSDNCNNDDCRACFSADLNLFIQKRTSGFAIIAMIQPITKGIKYEITDGTTNTTNSKITTAVIRFNTAFTYFLDCLHML